MPEIVDKIISDSQARMDKSIATLKDALAKIRAGRAHPSLLEQIQVEYYGALVPISQVANINSEDARTLKVSPWEKDMVAPIEKAIMSADLGLNPNSAGATIRIPLPPLTEQRRKDLIRLVKEEGEKTKVAIRHIRRDANNDFKDLLKEKTIPQDLFHDSEEAMQQLTDKHISQVEAILSDKEASLLDI